MTSREMFIALAVGAMSASTTYHASLELEAWQRWKADCTKGKRAYKPMIDNAAMVATFEDLLNASLDALKAELPKLEGDGGQV
jgi:hypothetical protein